MSALGTIQLAVFQWVWAQAWQLARRGSWHGTVLAARLRSGNLAKALKPDFLLIIACHHSN